MKEASTLSESTKSSIIEMIVSTYESGYGKVGRMMFEGLPKERISEKEFAQSILQEVEEIMKENGCESLKGQKELSDRIREELNSRSGITAQFLSDKRKRMQERVEKVARKIQRDRKKWEEQDKSYKGRGIAQQEEKASIADIYVDTDIEPLKDEETENEKNTIVGEKGQGFNDRDGNITQSKQEEGVNFEQLYNIEILKTEQDGYKAVTYTTNHRSTTVRVNTEDSMALIRPIGILEYVTNWGVSTYITKYSIIMSAIRDGQEKYISKMIYSNIDLNKLEEDEGYKKAVFEQLLSAENLEKKDNMGYVGEISLKDRKENQYGLYYEREDYTAVRTYEEQSKEQLQSIIDEVKRDNEINK